MALLRQSTKLMKGVQLDPVHCAQKSAIYMDTAHSAMELTCLCVSLTFSVTPKTLMASLTCWWIFFCISSSHTHRPRLHTAIHLNDNITFYLNLVTTKLNQIAYYTYELK